MGESFASSDRAESRIIGKSFLSLLLHFWYLNCTADMLDVADTLWTLNFADISRLSILGFVKLSTQLAGTWCTFSSDILVIWFASALTTLRCASVRGFRLSKLSSRRESNKTIKIHHKQNRLQVFFFLFSLNFPRQKAQKTRLIVMNFPSRLTCIREIFFTSTFASPSSCSFDEFLSLFSLSCEILHKAARLCCSCPWSARKQV